MVTLENRLANREVREGQGPRSRNVPSGKPEVLFECAVSSKLQLKHLPCKYMVFYLTVLGALPVLRHTRPSSLSFADVLNRGPGAFIDGPCVLPFGPLLPAFPHPTEVLLLLTAP